MTAVRKKRQRGSSLVEFTLVLLPIMAMLFITIDLAWVLFAWASIQEAVREGVRFAVTGQNLPGYTSQDASIRKVVQNYSFGFVTTTNASSVVGIQYYTPANFTATVSNTPGNVVKITISGISVTPLAPLWRSSNPIVLAASSSDIVEPNPNPPSR